MATFIAYLRNFVSTNERNENGSDVNSHHGDGEGTAGDAESTRGASAAKMQGMNGTVQGRLQVEDIERPQIIRHSSNVLDLVFAMDCTASMKPYIDTARRSVRTIVEKIVAEEKIEIRMALVEYRDHPPEDTSFVTQVHDFTPSVNLMQKWLNDSSACGGGDTPEAVADALHAVLKLSWRPDATKICVLVADAPPHGLITDELDSFPEGCPAGLDPVITTRELAEKGICLYVVGCEPNILKSKEFFSALAYITGGQYVPLKGARALTDIIIGGAQEEMSLEQWMEIVDREIAAEIERTGGTEHVDAEALRDRLHEDFVCLGVTTSHVSRKGKILSETQEDMSSVSRTLSKMQSMKAMKASLNSAPASGSSPSLSMRNSPSLGSRKSTGMFSRLSGYFFGGKDTKEKEVARSADPVCASVENGDDSLTLDSYSTKVDTLSKDQTERMVQKSLMRLSRKTNL